MQIVNKEYSRQEILRRSNNLSSLYYARRIIFEEGKASGTRAIEVKTAGGLYLLLNCSRCLDIMELNYKGVNIGYLTNNGINSNYHTPNINPQQDFSSYWIGGMMTTCGLRHTGEICRVDGEVFAKHGMIGTIPADHVSIQIDNENITITGVVYETALRKQYLELHRTITIPIDGSTIHIHDQILNNTAHNEIIFLLYHINFGFPFLNKNLELNIPEATVIPANQYSADRISKRLLITDPQDNVSATGYRYLLNGGDVSVNMKNHQLGIQASVRYNAEELPVLVEWNSMLSGNYVLGIEPGTSLLRGRKEELADGYQRSVAAFSSANFHVELAISDFVHEL